MGGPKKKKKSFRTQSGCPESRRAGNALWPQNPPSPVPSVWLTPLDLSSPQGPGDGSGPEGQLAGVRVRRQQGRLMSGEL